MAIDWTAPMTRRARYFEMNPATWRDVAELDGVESCSTLWDLTLPTLGSASFKLPPVRRETWIRVYVHAEQDGETADVAAGAWLVPPPDLDWTGARLTATADGYTPLKELDDDGPSYGWTVDSGEDALAAAAAICAAHCRAPVVPPAAEAALEEPYSAGDGMSWLGYVRALLDKVGWEVMVDGMGRILFEPVRDAATLQPVSLKAGEFKQFMVTVRVDADAKPGLYRGDIMVSPEGSPSAKIPVVMRVLPYLLPQPKTYYDTTADFFAMLYCNPGYGSFYTASGNNAEEAEAKVYRKLKNQFDHNVTSPLYYGLWKGYAGLEGVERDLGIAKKIGMKLDPFF